MAQQGGHRAAGRYGSRRRLGGSAKDSGQGGSPNPLEKQYFFQDLPPGIQMVVLQGVKFRLSRQGPLQDLGLFDLDDLLDEEADDLINRNNVRRTITDWLAFAQRGE